MIDIKWVQHNIEEAKQRLSIRHHQWLSVLDTILKEDSLRKQHQLILDTLQATVNTQSKKIGECIQKNLMAEVATLKKEVAEHKKEIAEKQTIAQGIEKGLFDLLCTLPNMPHISVPKGQSAEENITIKERGIIPHLHTTAVPHWDLIKQYNLVNFEWGAKVTGSGFPFYINKGAKLQRALIQYFLDFNIRAGYQEVLPPFMVNHDSAFATGQLPDKEGQMYEMTLDKFFLIPTSEVPVTNIYRDMILKEQELPIKHTAYSPCFRREAGSFGKDVRGLNRVHQFEKVEIVQITKPENSYHTLNEMVAHIEQLVQSLGLPYRIVKLCGGDMGFTSALTYDFEVFSAAQKKWLEISSVSNFESFQTYRLKCRYKNVEGKIHPTHSLNGSSLALPRVFATLLENNQTEKGITIPPVLHPYTGFDIITL